MDAKPLTVEQAIAMLPKTKKIHTFVSASFGLLGADMSRKELVERIKTAKRRATSGPNATAMGHGLCISDKTTGSMFVATK
jgi:hypothetical protein